MSESKNKYDAKQLMATFLYHLIKTKMPLNEVHELLYQASKYSAKTIGFYGDGKVYKAIYDDCVDQIDFILSKKNG